MSAFIKCLTTIDHITASFLKGVVVISGIFIAIAIVAGIIARSALNISVFGSEELILIAAIWLYMLGAALASRERSHLGGDFVQVMVKNKTTISVIQMIASLFSLGMAIFFLACALRFVSWSFQMSPVTPVFGIPLYIPQASLLAASALMCIYTTRDLINDVILLKNA